MAAAVSPGNDVVLDAAGWCHDVERMASPNCDARPSGSLIELLVIHAISLPPGEFGGPYIRDLFLNRLDCDGHPYFESLRGLRVSAHFLIDRLGRICQFVATQQRAWHAGVSVYRGRPACNDFSIGIELEGCDQCVFTDAQYQRLVALTLGVLRRHPEVPPAAIVGHSDIAPARKTDPGPCFDWGRYRRGLAEALANAACRH